jgi:hypothetical protein
LVSTSVLTRTGRPAPRRPPIRRAASAHGVNASRSASALSVARSISY